MIMEHGWSIPVQTEDKAKKVMARFKNLRRVLKQWQKQLSNLANTISNNKVILLLLDTLEEDGDLSLEE